MNINDITDPLLKAALAEDPDETPEEKKLREDMLAEYSGEEKKTDDITDDTSDDTDDADDSKDEDPEDKKDDGTEEDIKDDAKEDIKDEDKVEDKTRKEKRKERFLDSILKDNAKTYKPAEIPKYDPLDYEAAESFKPEDLKEDRERHGAIQYAKGAETVKYWADQDRFWNELTTETKFISYDPKLNFLSEKLPDGKPNPAFDPDKTAEINETYMQLIGYKESPKVGADGKPVLDQNGQPVLVATVDRTNVSYEKFARRQIDNIERWSRTETEDKIDEVRKNVTQQKKKQGIRPGGGSHKTLGAIKPGDISKMSDEEFEKHEAEIDRQIMGML